MARSRSRIVTAALLASLAAVAGCTFEDGDPWGELRAELTVAFDPSSRQVEGRPELLRTAMSYAVEVERLDLSVATMRVSVSSGGEALSFDPADPPPGYSLCHNGHCHADGGALVSYEDIAVELATSGGGGGQAVVRGVDQTLGLTGGAEQDVELVPCEGEGCYLQRGRLTAAQLDLTTLTVTGRVVDLRADDPRLPEGGVRVSATVTLGATVGALLDARVGRGEPVVIDLDGHFLLTERLFDGVAFGDLLAGRSGEVDLSDEPGFVEPLVDAIETQSTWEVTVSRRDR